ncbi:helix-turn-helix domain-containing protein [Shimia marina]|uniref:Helix-turn-helix protein n=1 Tax=Shimia marina TaxID=321267 RepID=A0A0P1FC44_9RHOB|nr:helix-turn-helix transcriptional regulator [Shimia marina]CUH53209.1 helix-turn-helix protein [Shimia marina]SFD82399.1 Helix-turn-helix [Shimia marina]
MIEIIDKRLRADRFRQRLATAMQDRAMTQAALARHIGVDRSTISQLLKDSGARLPNAQVVGECAAALGVSADWLLSLTDRPENTADILANALTVTKAPRALVDEQIFAWHKEAAGYKIRHVPAGLPDMLKIDEMLVWEYSAHLGRTTEQAINASRDRLDWMRSSPSDYEIALPRHELAAFARGEGYYTGLPEEIRTRQLAHFATLSAQLYPRMRLYLFDAHRLFSSPITVFGPLLAVLYLGRNYLAFRDTERVTSFTEHFDDLVRQADIPARQFADHVSALKTDG